PEVRVTAVGRGGVRDVERPYPRFARPADRALERGPTPHGQHRLGSLIRQRSQASSEPPRHDDRGDREALIADQVPTKEQTGELPAGIRDRKMVDVMTIHETEGIGERDSLLYADRIGRGD